MAFMQKPFLFTCIAITSLFAALPVIADDSRELEIHEQPLSDSLKMVADEFGLDIAFFPETTDGLESTALAGNYTSDEAFDALLDHTALEYEQLDNGTVVVRAKDERGASYSKKLSRQTMAMAQNQTSPAQTASKRSSDGGTSIVTGRVTDARTGANLKGAKVTIEETGQWTSTNDLGEFRFVNVPTGSATLTVSYLGYTGQSAVVGVRRDGASQNFALRGGDELEEIVVFGQRSARAQALNQERTAENITTVVSSDLLGEFPGTTISDALRRMPGVAFQPDERSGEGTNIIIRGLEPDLSAVKLNGVELPVGDGLGRSADLSNILVDSIEKITISKSLLPSQDSAGTGGLVEIETKSPLDRNRRFASFSVEGGRKGEDTFGDDFIASGTVSGSFGPNQGFGLSASVQYRDRDILTFSTANTPSAAGLYLPAADDGTPISNIIFIDPRSSFPFEDSPGADQFYYQQAGANLNRVDLENVSATVSAEWNVSDRTNLRFDYQRNEETRSSFSAGTVVSTPFAGYSLLPVQALGGELRYAFDIGENALGNGEIPVVLNQNYDLAENGESTTDVVSIRGRTDLAHWELEYSGGYASGKTVGPRIRNFAAQTPFGFGIDPALLLPDAVDPVEGRVISIFSNPAEGVPVRALFSAEAFELFDDTSQFLIGSIGGSDPQGENTRSVGDFSARYTFNSEFVEYIEAGVSYERSRFDSAKTRGAQLFLSAPQSLSDLGLNVFDSPSLAPIGLPRSISVLSESRVREFLSESNLQSMVASGLALAGADQNPLLSDQFTIEEEFSYYLQGRVDIGRLEIVGGVRFSQFDIEANVFSGPFVFDASFGFDPNFDATAFTRIVKQAATQRDALPRLSVNYRHTDNLIFRGAFYRSTARPQISQLSSIESPVLFQAPFFGPLGNQWGLQVFKGNPNLKPTITDSFEIGVELYDDNIGLMKLGLFYKEAKNLLESNTTQVAVADFDDLTLPDDPVFTNAPENAIAAGTTLHVELIAPFNNPNKASVQGVEAAFERQFDFLPGAWGGLGTFLNYTYTESSKTQPGTWFGAPGGALDYEIQDVPFSQSPEHSGTAALTYNSYGIDASLAYSHQHRRLFRFQDFGLIYFNGDFDSLDFRVSYRFDGESFGPSLPGTYQVFLEGLDLLRSGDEPTIENTFGNRPFTQEYQGGRSFRVGIRGSF